jgi:serine/threonine protein phosphatase 1
MNSRIFAIGDVHGHYNELQALFQTLRKEKKLNLKKDLLILLGDLVDSGPNVKEVVEWSMHMKELFPDTFHVIKGNHDDMLVDCLRYKGKDYDPNWWLRDSGYARATLASYGGNYVNPNVPQEHIEFLDDLPLFITTDDYFFVHAGVPPVSLSEIEAEVMKDKPDPELLNHLLWIRGDFYNSPFEWEKKIIFAHTPFDNHKTGFFEPYVRETMIGINTMPRNEGKLTALELPLETFTFQEKL